MGASNISPEITERLQTEVMKLRMHGHSYEEIAALLVIDVGQARTMFNQNMAILRAEHVALGDEMFILQHQRLENLWKRIYKFIDESPIFNDALFRTAITILERQSKLLGLDRKQPTAFNPKTGQSERSIESATPAELVAEVESYGFQVPKRFRVSPV